MDLEDYYLQACRPDATVSDIRPANYRDDTQSANAWQLSRALYASNLIFYRSVYYSFASRLHDCDDDNVPGG